MAGGVDRGKGVARLIPEEELRPAVPRISSMRLYEGGGVQSTSPIYSPPLPPPGGAANAAALLGNLAHPDADLVSPEAECSICLDTMEAPVRGAAEGGGGGGGGTTTPAWTSWRHQ